jgi:hypothetical protein
MNISADEFNRKIARLGIRGAPDQSAQIKEFSKVRIDNSIRHIAFGWCNKNFGDAWIWSSPTQSDYTDVYFANSEDATVFKLTFST